MAFITPNTLPSDLSTVPETVTKVAEELAQQSGGKLTYQVIDPDAPGTAVTRQALQSTYGLQPIAVSFLSPDSYYLHLLLQIGDEVQVLYPTGTLTEADIRSELEAAIKRATPGFLKTVGLWLPDLAPVQNPYGGTSEPISSWQYLQQQLSQNYTVESADLSTGRVPGNVDVLVLVAPQGLGETELYAVDQYLMRGGSVVVAGGNYALSQGQWFGGISVEALQGTLTDLLKSYGVEVAQSMVLDPQNEPFPIQVPRTVGGVTVTEIQQLPYPYFVDVRSDGMAPDSSVTANLPAVTLQWTSPLTMTVESSADREVTVLLNSTSESWSGSSLEVTPDNETYPEMGFPTGEPQRSFPLAVAVRGAFQSYFKDKASPLQAEAGATQAVTGTLGTVAFSPSSARLVVFGSAEFVDDALLQLSQSMSGDRYLYNLQLMQNAVDWSVEDEDLLSIRSRGTFARLLEPLDKGQQTLWEGLNYGVALVALVAIGVVWAMRRRHEEPIELVEEQDE
jgi:ABC-2 type transport system permease protein